MELLEAAGLDAIAFLPIKVVVLVLMVSLRIRVVGGRLGWVTL